MIKILIAPDSFKESMSAVVAAQAMADGIHNVCNDLDIEQIPIADGGEGTVDAIISATKGQKIKTEVRDPLMRLVSSYLGIIPEKQIAVIEMAAASGLGLLQQHEKNPLETTTYGTGELIRYALDQNCNHLIIGIGGSATNDAGCGMLQALGARFTDAKGKETGYCGKNLKDIQHIDLSKLDKRLKNCTIDVACDVNNPLFGTNGAAYVYARQKGANNNQVKQLDQNLRHFARIVEKQFGKNIAELPGAGAAGGTGAALYSFLSARLKPGFNLIADIVNLDARIADCDLILTGEGKIDRQTMHGKTIHGIIQIAKKHRKPVIAFTGSLSDGCSQLYIQGLDAIIPITDKPMPLSQALKQGKHLLREATSRTMRLLIIAKKRYF